MRCSTRTLLTLCLLVMLEAARVATASLMSGWNPLITPEEEEVSAVLDTLPQFHSKRWVKEGASSCGGKQAIPVNEQLAVKVKTATGERRFVMYVPESYLQNGNSTAALQLLFHGLNDQCHRFLNAIDFIEHANKTGFVLASLCGSMGFIGTAWNAGTCCGFFSQENPDDFDFAEKVVEAVSAMLCVNFTRVMAVGFSNGAMLAEGLACRKPKLIGAAVSVAGAVVLRPGNDGGLEECGRALRADNGEGHRPSILKVHGNLDEIVPLRGDGLLGFPSLKSDVLSWAQLNGCGMNTATTLNTTNYKNEIYTDCKGATADVESRVKGYELRANDATNGHPTGDTTTSRRPIVEVVHALKADHTWPSDEEFSTTNYIFDFARRVFF